MVKSWIGERGKAGSASRRRLVRHKDEPVWKLPTTTQQTLNICESHRRDLHKVCEIDMEFTQNGANIPGESRRLEEAPSITTDRGNSFHATSRQQDDQTKFLAEPAG